MLANSEIDYKTLSQRRSGPLSFCVSSGKGGVGKTLTVINMAVCAARSHKRVLVIDGDLGLSNVDVVLGLEARYNLRDVLDGVVAVEQILLDGPEGIKILPSGSGIATLAQLDTLQKQLISEQIDHLKDQFDLILIDTGAGIGDNIIYFNHRAHKNIVVTTPEPHAIADAYALVKVVHERTGIQTFDLIVNMTKSADEGRAVAKRVADVASRFLDVRISHLGSVPSDPALSLAILKRSVATSNTRTISGQAWRQITDDAMQEVQGDHNYIDWRSFMNTATI